MGFATVATASILTVAALIGGTAWVQADQARDDAVRAASQESEARQGLLQHTDMTLVSATKILTTVVVVVTNTGDAPIDAAALDVLIDGQWETDDIQSTLIDGANTDIWPPLATATITIGGFGLLDVLDRIVLVTGEGVMAFGSVV